MQPGPEVGDVVEDVDGGGFWGEAVGGGDEDGVCGVGEFADPGGGLVLAFEAWWHGGVVVVDGDLGADEPVDEE